MDTGRIAMKVVTITRVEAPNEPTYWEADVTFRDKMFTGMGDSLEAAMSDAADKVAEHRYRYARAK